MDVGPDCTGIMIFMSASDNPSDRELHSLNRLISAAKLIASSALAPRYAALFRLTLEATTHPNDSHSMILSTKQLTMLFYFKILSPCSYLDIFIVFFVRHNLAA